MLNLLLAQDEEIKRKAPHTTQLLSLLLNVQQPLQSRFYSLLRKFDIVVFEDGEDGGEGGGPCVRCGDCVPHCVPQPPAPLMGEEQIYPQ